MVSPSWEQFESPVASERQPQQMQPEQPNEVGQEQALEGEVEAAEPGKKSEWGDFQDTSTYQGEPTPLEEEGPLAYYFRHNVASAADLASSVVGKYGDLASLGKSVISNVPESLGVVGWAISQLMGKDNWEQAVNSIPTLGAVGEGAKLITGKQQGLPTSKELREGIDTLTGGYTAPKTPGEKAFHETVSDFGSLASLRRGHIPGIREAGTVAFANLGKEAVKQTGFKEDKADYAKYGIWTTLALLDKVNAHRYAAQLMNRARNMFNPNLTADVPRYFNAINNVLSHPNMLVSDPRTALARKLGNDLQNNIRNGQYNIQSLMTAYDGGNALKKSSGMFDLTRPGDKKFASRAIDDVLAVVRNEIESVGARQPQALRAWQDGLGAWRAINQSNQAIQGVQEMLKGPYARNINTLLGTISAGGLYSNPALTFAAPVAGLALNKGWQVGSRMLNDPVLQAYYARAITAAIRQDAPAFIRETKELDKELKKKPKK